MKKVFKSFLVLVCLIALFSVFNPVPAEAKKLDTVTVVRTVENGIHYVEIFVEGTMICKIEEL